MRVVILVMPHLEALEVRPEVGYDSSNVACRLTSGARSKVVTDMPDNKRVNLSVDLDSMLRDVKVATEEVKEHQEAAKKKEALKAEKGKSQKLSAIIIAVAAVVMFIVAYFVVSGAPEGQSGPSAPVAQQTAPKIVVKTSSSQATSTSTTPVQTPVVKAPNQTGGSQVTDRPSDEYEQPSRGM